MLTARGFRPSNTGMVLRIDLATRTLDPWFFRSGSGFQGGLAPGPEPTSVYIGYHTSTPTASPHLFASASRTTASSSTRTRRRARSSTRSR